MTVITNIRIPRTRRLAQGLFDGEYTVWPLDVAGEDTPLGLDVAKESCALCGGFFAPRGELRGFWDETATFNLTHVGCLVDAGNWAGK